MARLTKTTRMIQRAQVPVQAAPTGPAEPVEPAEPRVDPLPPSEPAEPIAPVPPAEPDVPVVPVETGRQQLQNTTPAVEATGDDDGDEQESDDPVGRHELSLDDDPDTSLVPSLVLHMLSEHGVHGVLLNDEDEAQAEHERLHQQSQQTHTLADHRFRPGRALATALHEPLDAPALA